MMRVKSTWASGARAMAVPGCPELAFWTASIASPRITLMALVSSSFAMRAFPSIWISQPAYRRPSPGVRGGPRDDSARPQALPRGYPMWSGPHTPPPSVSGGEQGEAGSESVEEVAGSDRAQFTGTEAPRQGERAEELVDHAGVVIGLAEE